MGMMTYAELVASSPSREGVGRCVDLTVLGERQATLHRKKECETPWHTSGGVRGLHKFRVLCGRRWWGDKSGGVDSYAAPVVFSIGTDDAAEAEAAYERAAEWVRTGAMPE